MFKRKLNSPNIIIAIVFFQSKIYTLEDLLFA